MRYILIAAAVVLTTTCAGAQDRNVPLDTNQIIVQPADTATNIFTGTARYVSRAVADTIENNGFVKTLNNLLGYTPLAKQTTQRNSNLPLPSLYQSTQYPTSFGQVMPTQQRFGQSFSQRR